MARREQLAWLIVLLAVLWFGYSYHKEKVAEAAANAQKEAAQAAQQRLDQAMAARDGKAAEDKQAIDQANATANTFAKQLALISQRVGMQTPLLVQTPPPDISGSPLPAQIEESKPLSKQQVVDLMAYTTKCEKFSVDLDACTANLRDMSEKYRIADEQAKTWEQTAKGGSWAKRVKHDAIVGGIAATAAIIIWKVVLHK